MYHWPRSCRLPIYIGVCYKWKAFCGIETSWDGTVVVTVHFILHLGMEWVWLNCATEIRVCFTDGKWLISLQWNWQIMSSDTSGVVAVCSIYLISNIFANMIMIYSINLYLLTTIYIYIYIYIIHVHGINVYRKKLESDFAQCNRQTNALYCTRIKSLRGIFVL